MATVGKIAANDKAFTGSIPEFYDTYLVPLIFEAYAMDLAERVSAHNPAMILETAAGSGVIPRALAGALPSTARYVVTDLNQQMLDHAAEKQGADDRIEWQSADALNLPFEENTFDAMVCQFGVMFYPDRPRGYEEAYRVLKPGGRYFFNIWDDLSSNDFAREVTAAVGEIFPKDPPRFLPRTPYGYFDHDLVRRELAAAGFGDVSITTRDEPCRAPSPRHPAMAYCQGTPLRQEIEDRRAGGLESITDEVTARLAEKYGDGPLSANMRAHVIVAQK